MPLSEFHLGATGNDQLLQALRRYPDRVALIDDLESLTCRQSEDRIARYQHAMAKAGVPQGAGVAVLSANRVDGYLAAAAAQMLGLRYTPLHPLGSLQDHLYILDDADIEMLIVDVPTYADRARELAEQADGLQSIFTLGPADVGADLAAAAADAGAVTVRNLGRADQDSSITYTGGTTGQPKGVLRTHAGNVAVSMGHMSSFEYPDNMRYLVTTPITHVGGTKIIPALLNGGAVVMHKGFNPEHYLGDIARHNINATLLVPTIVYVLLDHPATAKADLSSLELIMYGASPMSPTRLVEAIERFGPVFAQLYGQTECYPVTYLAKGDHDPNNPERLASCGLPTGASRICLLDDDGQEVAQGEAGEICVRGPQVMERYWKKPEETAATLKNGWLHTGDIARQDDRGYYYIVDRKKDMIVSGGFNVFPKEVEDVLTSDASVAMAAVIGVPDEKWGEAVKAVVVAKPGATVDPAALQSLVKAKKGSVHTPKTVDIVDEIPLTGIGKPDKKALRDIYWHDSERKVG